jgi:hypothetical protein
MDLLDNNDIDNRVIPIEALVKGGGEVEKKPRKKRGPNKNPKIVINQAAINLKKKQTDKMNERIIEILPLISEELVDMGVRPYAIKSNDLLKYFSTGFREVNTPASTEIYASKDNMASPNQALHSKQYERTIENPWTENSIRKSQMNELVIAPIQYDFMQSVQPSQGIYGGSGTLY